MITLVVIIINYEKFATIDNIQFVLNTFFEIVKLFQMINVVVIIIKYEKFATIDTIQFVFKYFLELSNFFK